MSLAEVYIISGFLGSGKTTLLQQILTWNIDMSSTIILINEFGEISIDGMLIDTKDVELLELSDGCICCSIRGDLIKTLEEGLTEFNPDRIFIETTGVADTLEVIDILNKSSISDKIVIKSVVCVLDAELWQEKENYGGVLFNQLKAANLVLLNKIDLIEKERVALLLEDIYQINQDCMVIPAYRCMMDPNVFLHKSKYSSCEIDRSITKDKADNLQFMSFVYNEKEPLLEACFKDFIKNVSSNVFRIKGIVELIEGSFIFNYAAGRSEWIQLNERKNTVLVFVGWTMDADKIRKELNTCKH